MCVFKNGIELKTSLRSSITDRRQSTFLASSLFPYATPKGEVVRWIDRGVQTYLPLIVRICKSMIIPCWCSTDRLTETVARVNSP